MAIQEDLKGFRSDVENTFEAKSSDIEFAQGKIKEIETAISTYSGSIPNSV